MEGHDHPGLVLALSKDTITVRELAAMTWEEVRDLGGRSLVAILPVGAVEAHGPHLPLDTDVVIATAMARAGAQRLTARQHSVVILPPLVYTAAEFAVDFPGTLSLRPETVTATVVDIAHSLAKPQVAVLAIANAHLDPTHLVSLDQAAATIRKSGGVRVAFPNLASRPWALRLSAEFRSGACHAGQFETSIVLAERRDAVREGIRVKLTPNPASLSVAIREGKRTFEDAGGPQAYFGAPADATAEEGATTVEILGAILEESVLAELDRPADSA
jgi:creatinine amidohydrolase